MKTWQKLSISILVAAGALALRAACSDACPGHCPYHVNTFLQTCNITYDAQTGQVKSATCTFSDGCVFSNNGGGSGGSHGGGSGTDPHPTKPPVE